MRSWNYGKRSLFKSCQSCPVRHVNCHANCDDYRAELKQSEESKRNTIEENAEELARALRWKV